ncbi:MAG: UDP-N-acetylmuramoyl-L-alanyl-D-glutamate--2,6-diaminopimelate ligase [Clostridia bacterium]|nr:UDP-N-acetylmuramoyl-L-alanyl-D-glutamate--2,6-diaminopimelate ligase [Clostridia bacterium]
MKLNKLIQDIPIIAVSEDLNNIEVKGIKYDSRQVKQGDLFVAIKGFKTDGHKFIKNALENGASAFIIEDKNYCSDEYPWVLVENSRIALADLSAVFFDHPSAKFLLIGVTGTNGKTTTTNLIAKIFEDQGHKVGLVGTIHNRIGQKILPVERTTPEASDLQELFAQMAAEGVSCVVMEVSSHALDLARVKGCQFDIAVFTNLTQDHLDYHQSMEEYFKAKAKLFTGLGRENSKNYRKVAVINGDDTWGQKLLSEITAEKISYGTENDVNFKAENIIITSTGVSYRVNDNDITLQLTGKFNVYNSLAALAVAYSQGIPLEQAIKSLENVSGIPGRFQLIEGTQDFAVIVDYAHTPDSLINILTTAREFAQGRSITVFGCGGDRDRTKRPLMGKAAAQYSDFTIITSDNPRTEDPEKIIEDILPGVKEIVGPEKYQVITDRKEAIKEALKMAKKDDIILIAGKGHETYQEINGVKYPFDDKKIAEELLKQL